MSTRKEDPRGSPRPPLRSDADRADERARAAQRVAELTEHLGDGGIDELFDGAHDNFQIDRELIPDGWDYEWKRRTVYGAEDRTYQVSLARTGWTTVPAERHPEWMPENYDGQTIERDGLVLMERPAVITARQRAQALKESRQQVRDKEAQLGAGPEGTFDRTKPTVKREFVSPQAIPE